MKLTNQISLVRISFAPIALAVSASFLAGTAAAQTVGIGTGPQGSLTYRTGAAVAKVTSEKLNLQSLVQPYSGNQQHIALVSKGRLQFGVNNIQETGAVTNGTGQFESQGANKAFRVVARLFPIPVGLLVRQDSPITKISDLRGKRVPVGYSSQKTVRAVVNALLASGGLDLKSVKGVPVPNTSRGTAAFMSGKADVAMSSLGGARLRKAGAAVGGIRILPIPDTPQALPAIQNAYPGAYIIVMKPRKGFPGITKPTRALAYDFLLNSSTEVPADLVYKVTKALAANKQTLVSVSGIFRGFSKEKMARPYKGVKYHEGAIRYYKEAGLWPPK